MTVTRTDLGDRLEAERSRLLRTLAGLDDAGWRTPSLCTGWTVRELVVHLLMPYELSGPRFLALMLRNGFRFDRAADRWATGDTRPPSRLLGDLRETEHRTFAVPGAPAEGELSHLVIHAQDVYRPLRTPSPTDPATSAIVLDLLTGPRGRRTLRPGLLDGVELSASDTAWRYGEGRAVRGPAAALLSTLTGRAAALEDLTGDGVAALRARLATEPAA